MNNYTDHAKFVNSGNNTLLGFLMLIPLSKVASEEYLSALG